MSSFKATSSSIRLNVFAFAFTLFVFYVTPRVDLHPISPCRNHGRPIKSILSGTSLLATFRYSALTYGSVFTMSNKYLLYSMLMVDLAGVEPASRAPYFKACTTILTLCPLYAYALQIS